MHFCFLQKKAIQDGLASHSAWLLAAPIVPVIEEPPPTYHPNILSFTAKKGWIVGLPSKLLQEVLKGRLLLDLVGTHWYSLRSSGESGRNVSVSLLMSTLLKPSSLREILSWEHFLIIKHEYGSIQIQYWRSLYFLWIWSSCQNPNNFLTFNCPPEIVITAKVAEVVSEVVQLVFDPARVEVKSTWHLKANHPHLDRNQVITTDTKCDCKNKRSGKIMIRQEMISTVWCISCDTWEWLTCQYCCYLRTWYLRFWGMP